MSNPVTSDSNQTHSNYLITALSSIYQDLITYAQHIQQKVIENNPINVTSELEAIAASMSSVPQLEKLCQIFGLSDFERNVLLLCVCRAMFPDVPYWFTQAHNNSQADYPTFGLALKLWKNSRWSAITPRSPLRRWQLLLVDPSSEDITLAPLRVDESILHYLMGEEPDDARLSLLTEAVSSESVLVASHQQLAEQMIQTWLQPARKLPILQVCGSDSMTLKAVAAAACQQVGLRLHTLNGALMPVEPVQLQILQCLCEREFHLSHRAWLLELESLELLEASREAAINSFIETLDAPLILAGVTRRQQRQRPLVTFEIHNPSPAEQRQIWQVALGERAMILNGQLETLISHFNLSVPAIYSACLKAQSLELDLHQSDLENGAQLTQNLWEICRNQARPRLDELAQRIEAKADWTDLILPAKEKQVLSEIAAHVRQRAKVYEQWEFSKKNHRGLGISALFSGASGTGKTTAAEILANTLHLDIYRIDLSAIVSKYIGETEKNLRRVFDAAEAGGVILLFDEADALFGKRSEVKDSHDRHANVEVSYLLQRMETYRGLAILTTNLKGSIDQAFMRRIRFIIEFPFPDAGQREEIWRGVFPTATPTEDLKFEKLAKLSVAGGNIRNIALNAAFIAADMNEPVRMKHILQAAQSEYIKMERPLTEVEVKGWV